MLENTSKTLLPVFRPSLKPGTGSDQREVPHGGEIVAYCRGPYCMYADEAVRLLTDEGRLATRLEEGFPEWKAAGLPIEQSAP